MAKFLTTGSTIGAVNLPEVALRERPDQLHPAHSPQRPWSAEPPSRNDRASWPQHQR